MQSTSKPAMILVAGPYRSGTNDDPEKMRRNLRLMEESALRLFQAGHVPIIGEWIALPLIRVAGSTRVGDDAWNEILYPAAHRLITHCDAVLRLDGASAGADEDVRRAREAGLPVYRRLSEVPSS